MSERVMPYVGVSGIVSQEQQSLLIDIAHTTDLTPGRRLLLGVKATHKTQYLDIPNKYGTQWYPVGEDAFTNALSPETISTFNVAQLYLDQDSIKRDVRYPGEFIRKMAKRGGKVLDALQFDMLPYHENPKLWSHTLDSVKAADFGVILQCHAAAMEKGPARAMEDLVRVSEHTPVDFVLFDASHGTGTEMDADTLRYFLEAGYSDPELEARGTNFGIAGGLDEYTVAIHLPAVIRDFPDISWDAEGRLHPRDGEGRLDMSKAQAYLGASALLLGQSR